MAARKPAEFSERSHGHSPRSKHRITYGRIFSSRPAATSAQNGLIPTTQRGEGVMVGEDNELSRRAIAQIATVIGLASSVVSAPLAAQTNAAGRPIRTGQPHPFYDYSPIVKRPKLKWPNGARVDRSSGHAGIAIRCLNYRRFRYAVSRGRRSGSGPADRAASISDRSAASRATRGEGVGLHQGT